MEDNSNNKKKKKAKKHSILDLFADSSPLMFIVDRAAFLAVVNICTLVCSIPVITAGGALSAAYDVLSHWSELTYDKAFLRYFTAFRENLKRSILPGLMTLAVVAILGAAWYILLKNRLTDSFTAFMPLLLASCMLGFFLLWLFPLLAQEAVPLPVLLRDTLRNALGRLLVSCLLAVIEAAALFALSELIPRSLTLDAICLLWGYSPFMLLKILLIRHVTGSRD